MRLRESHSQRVVSKRWVDVILNGVHSTCFLL